MLLMVLYINVKEACTSFGVTMLHMPPMASMEIKLGMKLEAANFSVRE